MNPDEYLKMLEERINDYFHNSQIAFRNYLSEEAKYNAALKAKEMYEQLIKDGKL